MPTAKLTGFAAALIVLSASPAAHAVEYYVAAGGMDGAARGTTAAPWATLQYAADRVNPGDTVHVSDGGYVGFNATRGGTAAAVVRFIGEGSNIRITTRNAVTMDGIIRNNLIYNALSSGISLYRIDASMPSRNNVVVNNTIIQSATGRWRSISRTAARAIRCEITSCSRITLRAARS